MSLLQGNTYLLQIQIADIANGSIDISDIVKAQFVIGKVEKFYGENGTVTYDDDLKIFLVPLSEEETLSMGNCVKWQVRILFTDGRVDGTRPVLEDVIASITKTKLTPAEENTKPEEETED